MAYGTISADVIQSSVTGVSLGAGNATVFKNRIINGDMRIDQRNAGASVTPTNAQYSVDRWSAFLSQASKFTMQQNAAAVTPPVGFINYLGITSSSAYSIAAGDYFGFRQAIEGLNIADFGWGTANAKTVTMSFQVYSSLTGTFGGVLKNSAANRSYPFTYTISSANTWTSISITVAGDTTGTWLTTNGIGIEVAWSLGTGSTYSGTAGSWSANNYVSATGATSVVGTSGATFYITGVQLEVGSSATGFEYVNYTNQLAMCQRYYETMGADVTGSLLVSGNPSSAQQINTTFTYKVTKRTTPTVTKVGTWSVTNASQPIVFGPGVDSFLLYLNSTAGGASYAQNISASYITISAEL